jgi:hypothetical protein
MWRSFLKVAMAGTKKHRQNIWHRQKRGLGNYFWGGSPLSSLKRNLIPLILGTRKVVNNGNH